MTIRINDNQYGKADVKVLKLDRSTDPHTIIDLSIDITLKGDMEAAFVNGDNSNVVPTDTMKNTVYILAKKKHFDTIEEFGNILSRHFVSNYEQITASDVKINQSSWEPIQNGDLSSKSSFKLNKSEHQTTHVMVTSSGQSIISGIKGLSILKSEHSGFENYVMDEYTTLKPTPDRVLATTLTTSWRYSMDVDFASKRKKIRTQLLKQFSEHHSKSVQETLYAMGKNVLEANPEVSSINLKMPNEHKILADLTKFNLENNNEIFVPTPEPFGIIEATLTRD